MLQKQAIDISFAQGLDTKTDPKRVSMGKFLELENTVFNKGGLLQKRNGYGKLTPLPDSTYSYLTTFNGNLTAIGRNIAAYNTGASAWVQRGAIQPLSLDTLPVIRNNLNQTAADIAIAPNGVACCVYLETDGTTITNKYVIFDSVTGQNLVAPAAIPISSGAVSGGMRVFVLGNNFIMVFTNTITATAHLQYVAVNIYNPSNVSTNTDIAAAYITATTLSWDGYVFENKLYIAYNTTSGGQAIKLTYLTAQLSLVTAKTYSTYKATSVSVTVDGSRAAQPVVYVTIYRSDTDKAFTLATDGNLNLIMNPVQIFSDQAKNITSAAQNGVCTVFYEHPQNYSFDSGIPTYLINKVTITPRNNTFSSVFSSGAGTITASSATGLVNGMYLIDNTTPANITAATTFTVSGTTLTLSAVTAGNSASSPGDSMTAATLSSVVVSIMSVGLASKAFIVDGVIYYLAAYQSTYQNTYFLINGSTSTSASPVIAAKLAYENGGGYLPKGLPGIALDGTTARTAYLFKDLIQAVNKNTNVPAGSQTAGIYSQTGINLASFTIGTTGLDTAEIGNNLNLSGGFHWMYDGYLPVEQNFFLFPDMDTATPTDAASWSETGGSIVAKPDGSTNTNAYYYQVTYEWTDNQGNAFKSAPSIPIPVTTTGAGSSGSVTLNIPTLRLTMKTANKVKIVIYRWSVAQQNYYQVTSISSPTLNSTIVDSIQYVDTLADATILGNNLLYTTGGVLENINAPGSDILAIFDTRLWLVDAEDRNLLYFSKPVIENTPVEMSDLQTVYIPPTVGTATGRSTAMFPQDDKLIISKGGNSFVYINGNGPDITGANNQYSEPIFITSTVGCSNQKSIAITPQGTMFQSNKGIWILGRDLSTNYIGAPVEDFTTGATVTSAVTVPETNQVRFTLDTGFTLMYDYYYDQWSTFKNVSAVSSCIFQDMHTFINSDGNAYQESAGNYLDGSNPVLMKFRTGPLRIGDLQNYQRAYFFYLLGTYVSPHKLLMNIAYDYDDNSSQSILIEPDNFSTTFGEGLSQSPFGQGTPFGGPKTLENWRVFLQRQRCMAFSITMQEIFDPELGTVAGAGLTLSGLNIVAGFKRGFRPQPNVHTAG